MTHSLEQIHKQIIAHNVAIQFLTEEQMAIQRQDEYAAQYYYELQELNHEDINAYFERNQDSVFL